MPDDGLVTSVKRFNGSNYQAWKYRITQVLKAKGVFDVVDGSRTKPENAEGVNGGRTKMWLQDDAKAAAIITAALEDEHVDCVLVCDTSKEVWDTLSAMHEQKSASNVGTLEERFYSYKMVPTDTVVNHLIVVRNMASQLKDLGQEKTERAIIAKIMSSLTTKYAMFKTACASVDLTRQTVSYLMERLIEEESNLAGDGESASALAVTTKGAKPKNGKGKQNIVCWNCSERGHYANKCYRPRKSRDKDDKGDSGHSSAGCAFVVTSGTKKDDVSVTGAKRQIPSGEQIRESQDADNADVWITDSGASEHVTSRRDWIEIYGR